MVAINQSAVVADFMQRDVITVSPAATLQEALELMIGSHVTGLPVMDDHARCVGLVTSSDILNFEYEQIGDAPPGAVADFYDPETQRWETVPISVFSFEKLGDVRVSEVMSTELVWVERDTPLAGAARKLLDERVHRLLVLDKVGRLYGVLSAYDFVRVVAGE